MGNSLGLLVRSLGAVVKGQPRIAAFGAAKAKVVAWSVVIRYDDLRVQGILVFRVVRID